MKLFEEDAPEQSIGLNHGSSESSRDPGKLARPCASFVLSSVQSVSAKAAVERAEGRFVSP
jgi:hypothetical protein